MIPLSAQHLHTALTRHAVGPFGADIHYYPQIGSTNDMARVLAERGAAEGTLVIADEQTAGRGRMGRRWVAPPGSSLMFSTIFRPSIPADLLNRLVMACGLSIAEGCEESISGRVDVKWPNDLHIGGKKFVGILPESSLLGERVQWLIVGMGVNVNQSFPPGDALSDSATSLREVAGVELDRAELLARILTRLNIWNARLSDAALLEAWRGRCITLGRPITAQVGSQTISGLAEELDETGALWLRAEDGQRHRLTISEATIPGR
jgi:BirA family transcriptional regulator, biotin operon repressor / biotin---[acetyl-CoA-carboxylase] ligase